MRRLAIALLGVMVACGHVKPRVGIHGAEVLAHASELGREGQARLQTVSVAAGDEQPGDRINVTLDQPVKFKGTATTLMLLLQGCAPFAGSSPCNIVAREVDLVFLQPTGLQLMRPDKKPLPPPTEESGFELGVVTGTLSLVSFAGMGLCLAYCESNKAEKSVALAGSGLLFGLIWAIAGGNVRD